MANFASDDYAQQNYNALTFGLPSALSFPAIEAPSSSLPTSVGWWASDDGLVPRVSGWKRKSSNDFRRYFLDVSPLTEIRAGDTLTSASDVSLTAAPNTISAGNYAVSGTKVYFTLEGGVPNQLYAIRVQFKLTSGTVLARVVRVVVDEYM